MSRKLQPDDDAQKAQPCESEQPEIACRGMADIPSPVGEHEDN
ncbi:hypothetical protein OS122_02035 [Mycolicibacterium mucogenicum]|nr:hypothetical protein [Mycolicibacterium mucogenicum]MCX8559678.1 hypothetical protein [Mycolicibacterium mucogenicum]